MPWKLVWWSKHVCNAVILPSHWSYMLQATSHREAEWLRQRHHSPSDLSGHGLKPSEGGLWRFIVDHLCPVCSGVGPSWIRLAPACITDALSDWDLGNLEARSTARTLYSVCADICSGPQTAAKWLHFATKIWDCDWILHLVAHVTSEFASGFFGFFHWYVEGANQRIWNHSWLANMCERAMEWQNELTLDAYFLPVKLGIVPKSKRKCKSEECREKSQKMLFLWRMVTQIWLVKVSQSVCCG